MQKGWLSRAARYRVEHMPFPDAGPLLADAYTVPRAVQHTTEGSTLEGAVAAYKTNRSAPTFTLGYDSRRKVRIVQHVPLGNAARSLINSEGGVETNRSCIAQIELVGVSPIGRQWQPDMAVLDALAAVYWQLWRSCGIPLAHVANPSRSAAIWQRRAGWYGHVDVPENFHVDPRDLRYANVFARARYFGVVPAKPVKAKPKPRPRPLAPGVAIMRLRARRAAPSPLGAKPSTAI